VYVQVVDKSTGRYRVLKSFGSNVDVSKLDSLVSRAQKWMDEQTGVQEFDFANTDAFVEHFFESIVSMKRIGYDLLLGKIFDAIGFNKIKDVYFRELVLARVAFQKAN